MILSADDGCASDIRLAELATKYGIECVFYWPVEWHSLAHHKGYEPLSWADACCIASEFEIGSHTITHPLLTEISTEDAAYEIIESKWMLEALLDVDVIKFCPPRGYTNPALNNIIDQQYSSKRLTKGKDLVHIHPNSGANDNKPWREAITADTKEAWLHSWELDKYNLWDELEGYLKTL